MRLDSGAVTISPSDLCSWMDCQWALLRQLDGMLGLAPRVQADADAMLQRTAELGAAHEALYLDRLREAHAGSIVEFGADDPGSPQATAEALDRRAAVIYQPVLSSPGFTGRPDFLVLGANGRYQVVDTKLARSARVSALIQIASYVDWLENAGVPVSQHALLVLGDGAESVHDTARIAPVYRTQRALLEEVLARRMDAVSSAGLLLPDPGRLTAGAGAGAQPVPWGDDAYGACGRCSLCADAAEINRDLVLVAGLRGDQRIALRRAGATTIDDLAVLDPQMLAVAAGMRVDTVSALCQQAGLQIATEQRQAAQPMSAEGCAPLPVPPVYELIDPERLRLLPPPDPGDIFFDFEGDPLYQEGRTWGIDYLFGYMDTAGAFTAYWAHTLAEEKQAFIDFLADIARRRAANPGMRIYHYAPYEKTHLLSLAARHGCGEEEVDALLRENVLIDLYAIVRQALRVGSRSYSIKKLEPLYMGDQLRDDDGVTNAAASIDAYVEAVRLREVGRLPGHAAQAQEAQTRLTEIADYNEYDCLSTLRLRDWLLELARTTGVQVSGAEFVSANGDEGVPDSSAEGMMPAPDPRQEAAARFDAILGGAVLTDPRDAGTDAERFAGPDAERFALALGRESLLYFQREAKIFWQEHFSRLSDPIEEWADTRDVFRVRRADVAEDWAPVKRSQARVLRLSGEFAPGSTAAEGSTVFAVFDPPHSPVLDSPVPEGRGTWKKTVIQEVDDTEKGVTVAFKVTAKDGGPFQDLPIALTPGPPPSAAVIEQVLSEVWAPKILSSSPQDIADPAFDLLARRPPRGGVVPVGEGTAVEAITATLRRLDRSYLAVQGPPGTGKTYTASRVIAQLVRSGWRIAVTGQSHAVVENVLRAVAGRGVPAAQILKNARSGDADALGVNEQGWTGFSSWKALWAHAEEQPGGLLVGGTAWMASQQRDFDLVVIDEAGQFSLPATIAVSTLAPRLLLLGDPQQLPGVSQAAHPLPVDESALGWLSAGSSVLAPELGYFLESTYRMHPQVTQPVSALSYDAQLLSRAPERRIDGVAPGLHVIDVEHAGCTTLSWEEADAVVGIIQNLLGRIFSEFGSDEAEPAGGYEADPVSSRPLVQSDVIVVAPFNAQVITLRTALARAGLEEVPVGTVDRFQGQEAAIAIMSMTASSAADASRGLDFLFSRNRLNVAVSRAQFAAFLVQSPELQYAVPRSESMLGVVSGYISLLESASSRGAWRTSAAWLD